MWICHTTRPGRRLQTPRKIETCSRSDEMLQRRHAAPTKCRRGARIGVVIRARGTRSRSRRKRISRPIALAVSGPGGLLAPLLLLAVVGIEQLLAQPDRLGGDLDELVVRDVGERLLQRHRHRRGQPPPPPPSLGAGVCERLAPERRDLAVLTAGTLACAPTPLQ